MKHSIFIIVVLLGNMVMLSHSLAANILVIESYHKNFEWDELYTDALKKKLGKTHKLTFFHMDTKRLPREKFQSQADLAWARYQKLKPDYVVLGDDNALKYLGDRFAGTDTPVVFLGINGNPSIYFKDKIIPQNITGVLERPLIAESMKNAKLLLPDLKRVLILFDDSHTSKAAIGSFMKAINSIDKKVLNLEYDIKFIEKSTVWEETIRKAKSSGYGAIFAGTYHTLTDQKDKHVTSDDLLKWTSKNSEIPIFALWSIAVGKGMALGGIVLNGFNQGEAAANLIEEIIAGKRPPILAQTPGIHMYSKSELKRWNIVLPSILANKAILVD